MRMNWLEKALMDGPSKTWMQRSYEAPLFERLGGLATGLRALEIGCGNGVGMEIALSRFKVATVDGLDIDPDQIERARKRLAGLPQGKIRLVVGDVTNIPAADATYDVVYDYAVLHHVIDWRRALSEIHRVLRPGGTFLFEEVPGRSLASWPARAILKHPAEDRFEAEEFTAEVAARGFAVGAVEVRARGHVFFGVGHRDGEHPLIGSRHERGTV